MEQKTERARLGERLKTALLDGIDFARGDQDLEVTVVDTDEDRWIDRGED